MASIEVDTVHRVIDSLADGGKVDVNAVKLAIDDCVKTAGRRYAALSKIDAARKKFRLLADEHNDELAAIQAACSHQVTKFHPDPSGNSDSWTECILCGGSV